MGLGSKKLGGPLLSLTATLSRLPIGRQAVWSMAKRDLGMDAILAHDVAGVRPYRVDWPCNKYNGNKYNGTKDDSTAPDIDNFGDSSA